MNKKLSRILVPTDFSEQSRRAFAYAVGLAEETKATIDLLHVWEPPRYVAPDLMLVVPGWTAVSLEQYSRTEAAKELEKFLAGVKHEHVEVRHSLEVGDPAASICRVAKEKKADLIVMGTHGRSGIARFLLGSTAQKVTLRADCPVLTVKTPDGKEGDDTIPEPMGA